MIGSIRGAITVDNNDSISINNATKELLEKIVQENELELGNIISIFFSTTKDLTAEYPAKAAREMGFTFHSLLCFQEMYVEGSLPNCIRVCILVNDINQQDAKHIYLRGAKILRPDII